MDKDFTVIFPVKPGSQKNQITTFSESVVCRGHIEITLCLGLAGTFTRVCVNNGDYGGNGGTDFLPT